MNRLRLYEFFIKDDTARMKAFVWSVCAGSITGAIAHFVFGAAETLSGLTTVIATICALTVFLAKYPAIQRRSEKPVCWATERRQVIKLSLASALETATAMLVTSVFGNIASAIAYAKSATIAVRSDRRLSPPRMVLAKQAIAAGLQNPSSTEDFKVLSRAYAQIEAAEIYHRATSAAKSREVVQNSAGSIPQQLEAPVWLVGDPRGSTVWYEGPNNTALFLVSRDIIFDMLIFDIVKRSAPQSLPQLLNFLEPSNVIFKNCTIRNFSQALDGIAWFDVTFEECDLTATLVDTLLVNVSFRNCLISLPSTPVGSVLQRQLQSGTASGVTFSSDVFKLAPGHQALG